MTRRTRQREQRTDQLIERCLTVWSPPASLPSVGDFVWGCSAVLGAPTAGRVIFTDVDPHLYVDAESRVAVRRMRPDFGSTAVVPLVGLSVEKGRDFTLDEFIDALFSDQVLAMAKMLDVARDMQEEPLVLPA